MHRLMVGVLATLLLNAVGGSATAAVITRRFDFTASGFTSVQGHAVPVDPVIGSVTVSFDPNIKVTRSTVGVTLNSLNIALSSPLMFSYLPNFGSGFMLIGGVQGLDGVQHGSNDFQFTFFTPAATPNPSQFLYTQEGVSDAFSTGNMTLSAAAVPEPQTWAMMIFGFGAIGGALRASRNRRVLTAREIAMT